MSLESIQNYYEQLVFEEIGSVYDDGSLDEDALADIACIALNMIPPKYIRHQVDMQFFMTAQERIAQQDLVSDALAQAYKRITGKYKD